jgi:hypothetical protein
LELREGESEMPELNMSFFTNTSINEKDKENTNGMKMRIQRISYKNLVESSFQYREIKEDDVRGLATRILADGQVLQELLVRKSGPDTYEILAGHKRFRACKYLVEQLDMKEFALIPCYIVSMDDIHAEFAVFSTNGYSSKSSYQIMQEIEGMMRLVREHPNEFPELTKKGRLSKNLANELGISSTTVVEYQSISRKLGTKGMEAFKNGILEKSAAYELSQLSEEEQEKYLNNGITKYAEIKALKAKELRNNKENVSESDTQRKQIPKRKIILQEKELDKYFTMDFSNKEIMDIIISLLEKWKEEHT